MMSLLSILMIGFLLGMRHATDADHVVAVTTIVGDHRSLFGAARIGTLWGAGHTATIMVVGGAIILFGLVIPPRLGLTFELGVGIMLVALGAFSLRSKPRHSHSHGRLPEHHSHGGQKPQTEAATMRPLLVGTIHGLAGSAAAALLVLGSIRNPVWGLAYLAIFGVGTIAGMMIITTAIALPFTLTRRYFRGIQRWLALLAGASSIAFGLFLIYQVGFVDGLFTDHPQWIPG